MKKTQAQARRPRRSRLSTPCAPRRGLPSPGGGASRALALACSLALGTVLLAPAAQAQAPAAPGAASAEPAPAGTPLALPAQPLTQTLNALARQFGVAIGSDAALLEGRAAPAIDGTFTLSQALERALAGSGLEAVRQEGASAISVIRRPAPQDATLPAVTVRAAAEGADGTAAEGYRIDTVPQIGPWQGRSLQDTPYSLAVVSSELMENIQASSVDQVFKLNPLTQLNDSQLRADLSAPVSIRGFPAGSTALNGFKRGWTNVGASTEDIERVEVLGGMSGFLYGAGDVGGLINYVTKRPTKTRYNALHVGNTSGRNVYLHGDFGGPIDDAGRFGYRINAVRQAGETQVQEQRIRRSQFSAAFDWRPIDTLVLEFDLNHREYHAGGNLPWFGRDADAERPPASALDPDRLWTQPWDSTRVDTERYGSSFRWTPSERLTLRGGYLAQRDVRQYVSASSTFEAGQRYRQTAWQQGQQLLKPDGWQFFVDQAFDTGPIGHRLTAGAYVTRVEVGASGDFWSDELELFSGLPITAPAPVLPRPDFTPIGRTPSYTQARQENRNWIVGDDIRFNAQWSALAGLNRTTIVARGFNPQGDETSRYERGATTPTLSLIYRPDPALSTYLSYIKGLEQGGTAAASYEGYPVVNANEVMSPMESRQIELGAKWSLGGLAMSAALYEIDKALQYYDLSTPTQPRYVQDGRQVHRGIEVTAMGRASRQLSVFGGLSWLDAEVRDQKQNRALEGKRPRNVSARMAKLHAEYGVEGLPGLVLTGGLYYNGPYFSDMLNTEQLGGSTTLDAGLRYETHAAQRPLVLRLNLANLGDKRYWNSGSTLGAARTLNASASLRF